MSSTATDPVCGMEVLLLPDTPSARFLGEEHHFCSEGCRGKFLEEPAAFLAGKPASPPRGASVYTCPMHPEIRQDGPGSCPLCGMSLEPLLQAPDSEADEELRDLSRRVLGSTLLTLPVIVLAMGDMVIPGRPIGRFLGHGLSAWLELAFATPVVWWAAWPLLVRFYESVLRMRPNMFTLIGLGVLVAYGYSVLATAFPGAFPSGFRDHHGRVGIYFEAAAAIVTLVLVGQVLELRARGAEQHGGGDPVAAQPLARDGSPCAGRRDGGGGGPGRGRGRRSAAGATRREDPGRRPGGGGR